VEAGTTTVRAGTPLCQKLKRWTTKLINVVDIIEHNNQNVREGCRSRYATARRGASDDVNPLPALKPKVRSYQIQTIPEKVVHPKHVIQKNKYYYLVFCVRFQPEICRANDSIARPRGSATEGKGACPAIASLWLANPKKTSGLVQAATARLM
jgi:hypothetical protein